MGNNTLPELNQILTVFLTLAGIGFIVTLVLFAWVLWRVKRISVPPNADFIDTLLVTPFSVVVLLDVLDMTFDILAAPAAWAILRYLNLHALKGVAIVESLIPGTQLLPTMTAAWIFARLTKGSVRF